MIQCAMRTEFGNTVHCFDSVILGSGFLLLCAVLPIDAEIFRGVGKRIFLTLLFQILKTVILIGNLTYKDNRITDKMYVC